MNICKKKKKIYIELGRKSGQNQKYNIFFVGGGREIKILIFRMKKKPDSSSTFFLAQTKI